MAQTTSPAALNEAIPLDIAPEGIDNRSHSFGDVLSDAQQQHSDRFASDSTPAEEMPGDAQEVPSNSAGTADVNGSAKDANDEQPPTTLERTGEGDDDNTRLNPDAVAVEVIQPNPSTLREGREALAASSGNGAGTATQGERPVELIPNEFVPPKSAGPVQSVIDQQVSESMSGAHLNPHQVDAQSHALSAGEPRTTAGGELLAPAPQPGLGQEGSSSKGAISSEMMFKDGAVRLDQGFRSVEATSNPVIEQTGAKQNQSAPSDSRSSQSSGVNGAAIMQADKVNADIRKSRDGVTSQETAPVSDAKLSGEGTRDRIRGLVVPISSRGLPGAHAQQLPGSGVESAQNQIESTPPETLRGVSKGLSVLAQQRGGSLKMRLDPPSLGTVRLEMSVEAGRVSVQIAAANDSARALLQGNLGMLRTALEERGLAVDRLAVDGTAKSIGDGAARSESRESGDSGTRGGDRDESRQDASQGRSRGRREHTNEQRWVQNDNDSTTDFEDVLLGA